MLAEIAPQPGDYDVPKHRWSAFHGTHLELSLRSRDIDTILLVGGSVHVGIAATAYDARDKDFQITIVPECCHGFASSAPSSWRRFSRGCATCVRSMT